jgi:dienelactone hydrolase
VRRSTLIGVAFLVVVVAAVAGCGGGAGSGSRSQPSSTTRPAAISTSSTTTSSTPASFAAVPEAIGSHAVGVHVDELVDASRPTPANGSAPGAPTRAMPTTIWYPAIGDASAAPAADAPPDAGGGPYPLVVFAHGFAVTPETYAELLARWASAGYVVAAPALPLLRGDAPGGASHADYGPANIADLRFAVDEATRRAAGQGDLLSGLADPRRVAVAGHSDGEVLAYALVLEPCCRDPAVGAAVLLAGNLRNARVLPEPTGVPVLHVLAERDEYNPYGDAIAFDREHLPAPSFSVTLHGADHTRAFRDATDPHLAIVALTGVDVLDLAFKDPARAGSKLVNDVAATGGLASLEIRGSVPPGD